MKYFLASVLLFWQRFVVGFEEALLQPKSRRRSFWRRNLLFAHPPDVAIVAYHAVGVASLTSHFEHRTVVGRRRESLGLASG